MAAAEQTGSDKGSVRIVQASEVVSEQVSVVLLTRNAGDGLNGVLDIVSTQILACPYEVLLVDSTSTDSTLAIAHNFPVRVYQIPEFAFGHGRTRNLSARLANGAIIVFLSQDAMPCGRYWLQEHLRWFRSENVAGVFGRQVPRAGALPTEVFSYSRDYPEHDVVLNSGNADRYSVIFSDVNSSLRKAILLKHPFPDDVIVSEDVYWASSVMSEGFDIVYSATAAVLHSHRYSLGTVFQVNFDQGVGYAQAHAARSPLGSRSIHRFRQKISYLIGSNAWIWIPYAIAVDSLRLLALFLGMHHRYIPVSVKKRIGRVHSYWTKNAG